MSERKYWRNEERTWLKDVVPLDAPYNIAIETSSLCNAKCIYCAHRLSVNGTYYGNMPMSLFYKIVDDICQFQKKIKLIEMFGFGEPLCNQNLEDMIKVIRDKEISERIEFTTNAILFTPKRIDDILAAGVDTIRVSLQGLNADDYQRICGVKIDFEQFVKNLEYLYKNRGNCKIRMKIPDIVLKGDAKGEECFETIFGDIADSIFIEHILPIYSDVNYDKMDLMFKQNAMYGRAGIVQTEIHKVCHRPFYRLCVKSNGDVTASCCDDPHDIRYGSIYENHLVDLWNGGGHKSFLRMQLEGKRFQHPVCKNCVMPNDITAEEDIMDPWAEEILARF